MHIQSALAQLQSAQVVHAPANEAVLFPLRAQWAQSFAQAPIAQAPVRPDDCAQKAFEGPLFWTGKDALLFQEA